MPAGFLEPGDFTTGKDGEWTGVETAVKTQRIATVYNCQIADFHTYFVGGSDWGFSVWAHNADYASFPAITAQMQGYILRRMAMYARGLGDCNVHAAAITRMFSRLGLIAVTRYTTGPGQHAMTYLRNGDVIVDVTASQFASGATTLIRAQFSRELMQTGLWTRTEYNRFFRSIYGPGTGF